VRRAATHYRGRVDWLTLASTSIGAALALAATLLAHLLRSRDTRDRDNLADRRKSYLDFVFAVEAAHAALRLLADASKGDVDILRGTREVMGESGVYGARERLLVSAHPAVVLAGERTLRALVGIRDAIRAGAKLNTLAYHDAYHSWADAIWDLRRIARTDLGLPAISPADVGKASWDSKGNCDFCANAARETTAASVP
jgi:hypothetical protein